MEIKEYNDDFFNNAKTIDIYNSYVPYYLSVMKRYYENNNVECIVASDTDLDVYLKYFPNVKYIYLNNFAVHLEEVNINLKYLNGISLATSQISEIDNEILENVEYLEIYYNKKMKIDFTRFKSVEHLSLVNYPYEDIKVENDLITFRLKNATKLTSLKGVNSKNLTKLVIDEAPKLLNIKDIDTSNVIEMTIENLRNLETIELICPKLTKFRIWDSKKMINLEDFLGTCTNLKSLEILSYSDLKAVLKNVNFIDNLNYLEYFKTCFKILDGNLKPLLKLKEADILIFYRNYNLKDKDLPHIMVSIADPRYYCGKSVRLDSLELGKEDPRILWTDRKR